MVEIKLSYLWLILGLILALFYLSYSQRWIKAQNGVTYNSSTWFLFTLQNETDYDLDSIPDVVTTITPMNDTFLEIYVNDTRETGAYKWASAICNISGVQDVGKWEHNPATDVWTYTPNPGAFQNMTFTHPGWCNETGNSGFLIYGAGSGDKRYRLNFTEGHKVIQIHAGKGSELKEAMSAKYYNKMVKDYRDFEEWVKNKTYDSYLNGGEFWIQDINTTIEFNGTSINLHHHINHTIMPNASIYYAATAFHKFFCFEYFGTGTFDTVRCPENRTNVREMIKDFARQEIKLGIRNKTEGGMHFYILSILVNNEIGDLLSINYSQNPSEDSLFETERKNPLDYKNYEIFEEWIDYSINYSSGNCLKFPIPRYSNVTLNITMPSPMVNFTLGNHPEIIVYNYTEGNSLLAKVKVYPCCGIQNMTIQELEVCS